MKLLATFGIALAFTALSLPFAINTDNQIGDIGAMKQTFCAASVYQPDGCGN